MSFCSPYTSVFQLLLTVYIYCQTSQLYYTSLSLHGRQHWQDGSTFLTGRHVLHGLLHEVSNVFSTGRHVHHHEKTLVAHSPRTSIFRGSSRVSMVSMDRVHSGVSMGRVHFGVGRGRRRRGVVCRRRGVAASGRGGVGTWRREEWRRRHKEDNKHYGGVHGVVAINHHWSVIECVHVLMKMWIMMYEQSDVNVICG